MHTLKKSLFYLFLLAFIISCTNPKPQETYTLGKAQLEVTGNKEATEFFDKGLLLLHSFEYDDAHEAFFAAQKADSTMAMAYWGEAMTYNHPLWRYQNYDKGVDAITRLGASKEIRKSKIVTEIEKDLFEAIEIMYGEGTKNDRDVAYSTYFSYKVDK